jgi:hypothetical protein
MANSLADQLGWCITTKDYLNNLNGEMLYVASQYQNMVEQLQSTGYMRDLLPMIENLNYEFDKEIKEIVKYIEGEHIAYIQKQSSAVSDQINKLMNL